MQFKVGDIVWCKEYGMYSETNYHVKCRVDDIRSPTENGNIFAHILEGADKGRAWWVNSKYFEHVERLVENPI